MNPLGCQGQSIRSEDGDVFRGLLDEDGSTARGTDAECEVHVPALDGHGGERRIGRENVDLGCVLRHVVGDGVLGEDFGHGVGLSTGRGAVRSDE